ncbi:MAG: FAD-dependent oxidoreductase [Planctomycetes bacterium]|nr:FAD-dependent oxidoreductase [Planctomycetota bacterium]
MIKKTKKRRVAARPAQNPRSHIQAQKRYDVLIVGGGLAGVAAALETARAGLRVAIVEKTILWGGLATTGLVPLYMPLCDGKGRQVTFGISEELLHRSIRYGPGRVPQRWRKKEQTGPDTPADELAKHDELYAGSNMGERYMTVFSPMAFALAIDEAMEESGAELWLDTLACTPIMAGQTVSGVEVENKSGRIALMAKCVIDATGDADIAFRAGAPCTDNPLFPSILYQYVSLALAREAGEKGSARRVVTFGGNGANEMGVGYHGGTKKYSATDGKDVSEFVMQSRRLARLHFAEKQKTGGQTSRENCYPAALPAMAQFRMSRMIDGQETVMANRCNQRCETSVGLIADCRKVDAVWEIPYGSLLPRKVEGLLAVGRCMAAEGYAWQVTRLIPAVALTGQVAGIAATLAVQRETQPHSLMPADVQRQAQAKGICLHIS